MAKYNRSIYIPKEAFDDATFFLNIKNIEYITRQCSDGTIEISTEKKFAKTLNKMSNWYNNWFTL